MRRLSFYFLLLVASIWLGVKIYENPGYVLIYYQKWAIETTVWVLGLLLLLVFFLLHLIYATIRGTIHLPRRIENWWQTYQANRAIKLLNKGFCDMQIGKFRSAEKKLIKGAKNQLFSFLDYMLAAEAANSQHAVKRRQQYLTKAKKNHPQKSFVVDVAHVQFLLNDKQVESALTEVVKLRAEYPKDPILQKLLTICYLHLCDWFHLMLILPEVKKNKVFDEREYLRIEKETYFNLLKEHFFSDFSEIQKIWNKIPRYLKQDADILIAYAVHLVRWHREQEAEKLIRKELKKHNNPRLMEYYVTLSSNEPAKQVALGEKYLKGFTEDAAALRAMGQLCLRNRLWGQARDYLEKSAKKEIVPEVYTALGYVYENLGENEKALRYYRKGMTD